MNREALPLVAAILVPLVLVAMILLYLYGYDITSYLKGIDPIYYIILFPFAIGLVAALLYLRRT